MKCIGAAVGLLFVGFSGAHATVTLFDFENDSETAAWTIRSAQQDKLTRSPRFATSGQSSMEFRSPAWKTGMEQWPAFEAKPLVADWRPCDRLVIDVVNPDAQIPVFNLFVSDSKVPFREGLSFACQLPSRGYKRFVVPLSSFPEKVNRADISIIHFYSQRPEGDLTLYLDSLTLLKPGEEAPPPAPGFVRQVAALTITNLDQLDRTLAEKEAALLAAAEAPAQQQSVTARLSGLRQILEVARQEVKAADLTVERLDQLQADVAHLPGQLVRLDSLTRFEADFDALKLKSPNMLVGFATAAEKVLPRDMPFRLQVARDVRVRLARNEKESVQVLVTPRTGDLKQVQVSVGDLKGPGGAVFSAKDVNCDVTGYVQTKQRPPYDVSYIGWWPDPILDFLGPVDIAAGDLQSFWVRFRAPKDQPPGLYRGTLQIAAAGCKPLRFGLSVQVFGFTLPSCTPLPTAITFFEQKGQMGGEDHWRKMKLKYADFLADYYMDYDSLYRHEGPDFEILKHRHDQGTLTCFNFGYFGSDPAENVARFRPTYEKAKELGLLDHAYIYGFDECPVDQFSALEATAKAMKQAFPEVPVMTTSYDGSYGQDTAVKSVDAWCPLTPSFIPAQAAKARAAGKMVWWYICCGPHHPFANWFVEYPALDARLLMGAMVAKQRPDGFLYYSLTIWNDNKPIEKGPFTDWNPVSWTVYHGDGSLFCSGPGGMPVPTIRLENYRDGQEDFAYVVILESIIRRYEARPSLSAKQRQWLADAQAALPVPTAVVTDMTHFTSDPAVLYAWRNRIGELINTSGMRDVDPWGKDFGVSGFRAAPK